MIQVDQSHKKLVVDILAQSFGDNKSVNYVVKQDANRAQRIRCLMEYAFDMCLRYGKVYLSDDKDGCALVLLPDRKKTGLSTILLDARLMHRSFGLVNIQKVLGRESKIKKAQLAGSKYYLWFIGVRPDRRGNGVGGRLLTQIMGEAKGENCSVCLETSTEQNLPWYKKHGFEVYNTLDFSYPLYFLKA